MTDNALTVLPEAFQLPADGTLERLKKQGLENLLGLWKMLEKCLKDRQRGHTKRLGKKNLSLFRGFLGGIHSIQCQKSCLDISTCWSKKILHITLPVCPLSDSNMWLFPPVYTLLNHVHKALAKSNSIPVGTGARVSWLLLVCPANCYLHLGPDLLLFIFCKYRLVSVTPLVHGGGWNHDWPTI